MTGARARRRGRRLVLLVIVLTVLGGVVVWLMSPTGPRRRVLDQAGIIPAGDVAAFDAYLHGIFTESDVDIRMVFVRDLGDRPIEESAVERMAALGIGRTSGRARGALFLYDVAGRRLRVEVGYGLEEYFPDAFVGYLMREHVHAFFGRGDVSTGLRLTLRMIHHRIRSAILGDAFDPRVLVAVRRSRGDLSGGAGVSAPMRLGHDPSGFIRAPLDAEIRAQFGPQSAPDATFVEYLNWLALGRFDPDVAMFTPDTRRFLAGLPVTRAYFDYVLLSEYGRLFEVDTRGDVALLYFTNDPLVSPHLFRRTPAGWQMDIVAEVRDTRNDVGGVYVWDWRGTGDDFSRAFADRIVTIGPHTRIAGGDNRPLPRRRHSP